jgi:hypothetical protein
MLFFRWFLRFLTLAVVIAATAVIAARVHDGPLGPLPGGPLEAGATVVEPVADWSFATDVEEIELQLASQDTSRTTWVLVQNGKAYIPASTQFPPGKTWHQKALEDGRATVRIDGRKFAVTLAKVDDETVLAAVREIASKKYRPPPGGAEGVWLFSVTSR